LKARRKKMMDASETIDRLRHGPRPSKWNGAREIRKWRDTGDGVLVKPEHTTPDLAGSGAKKARVSEMKRLLDPNACRRFLGRSWNVRFGTNHKASLVRSRPSEGIGYWCYRRL